MLKQRMALLAALVACGAASAFAEDPNVSAIVTAASTVFTAVAGLCITIGTFWVGYRIVRKIK